MVLILCLSLLPATALAAENAPTTLYVGNYQITIGNATTYLKAGSTQGSLVEGSENDWTVKYDPSTATLTLNGATITGIDNISSVPYGAGIYAQSNSGQPVALTIELIGENTITGNYGVYVNAEMSANSYGTDASLNITGNGSLIVTGTNSHGIFVKSGTGNASLTIYDASVVANTTQTYSGSAGVCVQSSVSATSSPNLSLAVHGGSLAASGTGNSDGILLYVGSSQATGATTSLTVTDNAIVRAKNGIKAERVDKPTPSGAGIVFDGRTGTVYGDVTLQENITINEGESLTIPDGASLNTGSHEVIVNGGTLTGVDKITGTVKYAPTITTESLPDGTVGTAYSQTLAATGSDTITWSVTNGSLPDGLTLNTNTGEITGTPTTASSYPFTVKAENAYGSKTKELTININDAKTYSVSVTPAKITLPSVKEGYDPQDPEYITIKNTGNQTILLEDHDKNPWLIITLDKNTLKPNEEAKVSIKLKDDLSAETRSTLKGFITYTSEDDTYRDYAHFEVTFEIRHDMKHIEAKAATHLEEGNIAYWYCEYCDKYYKDGAGANELSLEDITIPKLKDQTATGTPTDNDKSSEDQTGDTTSSETGDDSNIALWIAVMLTAGTAMTGTVLYGRRKKHSR